MRYKWRNNVDYISFQNYAPMLRFIFNPRQIDAKYCVSTDTIGNLKTEVYQMKLRHKKFADLLNVVCILKTNLTTKQQAHVLVFSSDLTLDAEKMIDYYALRFQIEFNFRDAKQYWGLQDFMNVNKIPMNNAVNLSMFMVSVSAKLTDTFRCPNTEFSVLYQINLIYLIFLGIRCG